MRVIIIDDEKFTRNGLRIMLERNCEEVSVVAEADDVKSGIEQIKKHQPDLILLDIQLKDSNGFELLKSFDTISFKTIFITAYDEYAIQAFKFSAVDYLLKPVSVVDLKEAINRARESHSQNTNAEMDVLLSDDNQSNKKIVLKTADSIYVTPIDEIIRCEANGNYTKIHLDSGETIMISQSLKEYDELFKKYAFFRAHAAHLINLNYLTKVKKSRSGNLFMKDGSTVPLAHSRKQELLQLLQRF